VPGRARRPAKRTQPRVLNGRAVLDVTGTAREPRLPRQNPAGKLTQWNASNAGPLTVKLTGPMFDGRIDGLIDDMLADMMGVAAAQGYADVMLGLNEHIQHPTPYYETQINIARDGLDLVVNDRGVVYGPWLEGTSSRNRTTRFKGYMSFRRAADELRRKLPALLGPTAAKWTARFNGA
jgi:hypothetical protein